MRDPEVFKYDVRVRDRMLRAGRITPDEVNQLLHGLPDLEGECEEVPLAQPALELGSASVASGRQALSSVSNEIMSESQPDNEGDT